MRVARKINLTNKQKKQLQKIARGRKVPVEYAQRADIILLADQGMTNKDIAEKSV